MQVIVIFLHPYYPIFFLKFLPFLSCMKIIYYRSRPFKINSWTIVIYSLFYVIRPCIIWLSHYYINLNFLESMLGFKVWVYVRSMFIITARNMSNLHLMHIVLYNINNEHTYTKKNWTFAVPFGHTIEIIHPRGFL